MFTHESKQTRKRVSEMTKELSEAEKVQVTAFGLDRQTTQAVASIAYRAPLEFDRWLTEHDAAVEAAVRADMQPREVRTVEEVKRPEIVVLCGSTRFYDEFQQANFDLTMAGKIVLSVGFYPHAKAKHGHGEGVGHDSAEKVALDELHKRKIDIADSVLVLNVGGYIGESTRSEIAYALSLGKPVTYLVAPSTPNQTGAL